MYGSENAAAIAALILGRKSESPAQIQPMIIDPKIIPSPRADTPAATPRYAPITKSRKIPPSR